MNQQRPNTSQFIQTPGVFIGGNPYGPGGIPTVVSQPPPLPPRRMTSRHEPYGNNYGPNVFGTYGGYNSYGLGNNYGYNPYGGFGNSYRAYGPSGDVENTFMQFAEESSRSAFQSVESIIHTFSSITMMLESTFLAMTSSFRAMVNVAENVTRVQNKLGQLLSTITLVRSLKELYQKIMYYLGLRSGDAITDATWRKTLADVTNGNKTGPKAWVTLTFLGLLFAIPYLIHKLVNSATTNHINVKNPQEWFKANEPVYSATTSYDFVAASPDEMSFKAGQKVWLAPKSLQPKNIPGWVRATDTVNVGLIPSNYITVVGQLKKKSEIDVNKVSENENLDKHFDESFSQNNKTDAAAEPITADNS